MIEVALTTIDNPFDPFTQFSEWYMFDLQKGYNSCSYLGRVSNVFEGMSDKELNDETERAIDEIIKNDFLDIYTKVKRENPYNITDDTPLNG